MSRTDRSDRGRVTRGAMFAALAVLVGVAVLGVALGWWAPPLSEQPPPTTATDPAGDPAAGTSTTAATAVATVSSPLTGLPMSAPADRRAIVVKVDSHPSVRRFAGLERADLIYEVLVEGGITRYLAVFHSEDPGRVGPVRSLRSSDFDLVAGLGRPVVVFSGGAAPTLRAAASASLVPFRPGSPGSDDAFRRDRELRAPHNLFVSLPRVREAVDAPGTVSTPFVLAATGDVPGVGGERLAALRIRFSAATDVLVEWDADRGEWLRSENGRPQLDDDGRRLGTANVVVLFAGYTNPPWDSTVPEAISVGTGEGLLLSGGTMTTVTWRRPDARGPFELSDAAGRAVPLPPGRSWVALPPPGTTTAER